MSRNRRDEGFGAALGTAVGVGLVALYYAASELLTDKESSNELARPRGRMDGLGGSLDELKSIAQRIR